MTADELTRVFGARVLRERISRGLSMRALAAKGDGLGIGTISRAECGHEVWLSSAAAIASALGIPLTTLIAEPDCAVCDGQPPGGFTCNGCGKGGGDS